MQRLLDGQWPLGVQWLFGVQRLFDNIGVNVFSVCSGSSRCFGSSTSLARVSSRNCWRAAALRRCRCAVALRRAAALRCAAALGCAVALRCAVASNNRIKW